MALHADIALIRPSTIATFSTSAVVGISVVITGTIALVVGVLAGVLLHHCIIKYRSQSPKAESSSHQQQQEAGPEYEEVPIDKKIELRENVAYGPAKSIELSVNQAYGHVQH